MEFLVNLEPMDLASLLAIFVGGGMVKGALGFGLPLVTVAVLPLVVPVDFALAINALILPFTNIAQLVQTGEIRKTLLRFRYVIGGVVLGVPLGAALVTSVSEDVLMLALGVFIVVFVALTLFTPHLTVPPGRDREVAASVGLLAGVLGALTTANGPLFVMHLVALKVDRRMFLSALGLLFIISGALISGAFWIAGLMDLSRLIVAGLCLPAALLGMKIGNGIGTRIPAAKFRALVLAVLCLLAANLVLRGVSALLAVPSAILS